MTFESSTTKKSIFTFFVENSRFTILTLVAVILLGATALLTLDVEANPEINQPIGIVQTFYPNSSPSDVESQITKPLEEEISGLSQLKEISSVSDSNVSFITVTFVSSADSKEVIDKLRIAVDNATGELPEDAEIPQVIELDFNAQSIVTLSLTGQATKEELTKLAEDVEDKINRISGVSKVETTGDVESVLQVKVDPVRMESYGLTVPQVVSAITSANLNAPLGSISKDSEEITLRLLGKATSLEQVANLPIRNISGQDDFNLVTLSNVAEIVLEPEDEKTQSFVSDLKTPARNSVTLNVFKSKGGNIINIVKQIDAEVAELNETLPDNIEMIKTNDNAYFIRTDLATLSSSGIQTMFIIFFAMLLFLAAREALVAALSVPIIFLMTFALLMFTGQNINGLTIFSLILSLGLVVDTSVVIVEGIHEGRNQGLSRKDAALKSITTYQWPLISGTMTTIAAFLPMLLVSGVVGEFIKTIPMVLTVTLLSSLFVSFVFTPFMGNYILKADVVQSRSAKFKADMIHWLESKYEVFLSHLLGNGTARILVVVCTLIAFLASLSLPFTGILKAQLFTESDVPFIYINIEAPIGTPLNETRNLVNPVEEILAQRKDVQNYVLNVGAKIDTSGFIGNNTSKSYYANMIVNLVDEADRDLKSYEINSELRESFKTINNGVKVTVEEVSGGPPTAAPFGARIIGSDLATLKKLSFEMKKALSEVPGLINISTDFDNLSEEVLVNFDQDRLAYFGVTNQQVALFLQSYTNGIKSGKVEFDGKEYDIKVFLGDSSVKEVNELQSISIPTTKGNVPLDYLGSIGYQEAIQAIPRTDQERSVRIEAYTNDDVVIANIQPEIDAAIAKVQLPSGYSIDLGGEDEDVKQSFADLFNSMFIGVILILVILVLQFNSFRQTFMILVSLPLAIIGIFPGLTLLGLPLSFPAFLGVVMLSGIAVNDAIVMIDQINNKRAEGIELNEAVRTSATSRLVPIFLTSITTILGLLPITLTDEFWRGLGSAVIFGLTTSTFLTLVIIPIFYTRLYREKKNKGNL